MFTSSNPHDCVALFFCWRCCLSIGPSTPQHVCFVLSCVLVLVLVVVDVVVAAIIIVRSIYLLAFLLSLFLLLLLLLLFDALLCR